MAQNQAKGSFSQDTVAHSAVLSSFPLAPRHIAFTNTSEVETM